MKTMLFPTDNNLSACVFWHKVQADSSVYVKPYWHDIDSGICMGMVLVWMKKSIATKGKGIHNVEQLGSPHLMAIVHGAYRKVVPLKELKHEVDIITHMFITQNLTPGDQPMRGKGYFDPEGIVDWVLKEPCHCLFSFGSHLHSYRGRHVIGLRYENQIMELFDPNKGLYQYSDEASFKEHMQQVCYLENVECIGGEWAVLKGVSDID